MSLLVVACATVSVKTSVEGDTVTVCKGEGDLPANVFNPARPATRLLAESETVMDLTCESPPNLARSATAAFVTLRE